MRFLFAFALAVIGLGRIGLARGHGIDHNHFTSTTNTVLGVVLLAAAAWILIRQKTNH